MGCAHVSKAKDTATPVVNRDGKPLYNAWDMVCGKCGIEWTSALRMTTDQIKKDKDNYEQYGIKETKDRV